MRGSMAKPSGEITESINQIYSLSVLEYLPTQTKGLADTALKTASMDT